MKGFCWTHQATFETERQMALYVAGWSGTKDCPECETEYAQRLRRERFYRANIQSRFREKDFDAFQAVSTGQRHALQVARAYCKQFAEHAKTGRSLVFLGRIGTGKTHLGCSIAAELAFQKWRVLYVTVAELICNLRAAWAKPVGDSTLFRLLAQAHEHLSESLFMDKLAALDLLVLDEVGRQYGSESERVQLGALMDMRYQCQRPSVVISNCDVAGLECYLGEQVVDRLRESGGEIVFFNWESRRGRSDSATA